MNNAHENVLFFLENNGHWIIPASHITIFRISVTLNEESSNDGLNESMISDTVFFPDILRGDLLDSNEEYVSYDVDSLFTRIPLDEAIYFILDKIYVWKKLETFCKKSV